MTPLIPSAFISALEQAIGSNYVLKDPSALARYSGDRSNIKLPSASLVALPNSTTQVASAIKLANQYQVSVVASGGRTGLSGGAVASLGQLVLSLERMNNIIEVNTIDQTIQCQAGVITQQLQTCATDHGLFYPVDFAAVGSSQIGGNIATNAGGIKVVRYGMTRAWVRGLIVVTGSGDVLELNKGLIKNNTGYDFRHLFIGSEGTLGIICEATVALTTAPINPTVMVLALSSLNAVTSALTQFQQCTTLTAFEFFDQHALQAVTDSRDIISPFNCAAPYYALLEFDNTDDSITAAMQHTFNQLLSQQLAIDGVISHSQQQAQALWRLREDISEQLAKYQPYKNDVAVRVSRLSEFIRAVEQLCLTHYQDWQVVWYGHIGDGNLHLNILKPEKLSNRHFNEKCQRVSRQLAAIVQQFDGTISAEHGVGLVKKSLLDSTRSSQEIGLMKQIKQIFDPNNIMNPGKIFD